MLVFLSLFIFSLPVQAIPLIDLSGVSPTFPEMLAVPRLYLYIS